jgi:hypothetical protein
MHQLYIDASVPRPLLVVARQAAGNLKGAGTFNHYIFGYINSRHY